MNIWTIRTDDNCGDQLTVFTDEQLADEAALEWCKRHWFGEQPCPEDWTVAYETIRDGEHFIWFEEHQIDAADAVQAVITSAQAQLNDLLEQISQMRGMFSDDDGCIQSAVEAAEAWPNLPQDEGGDDNA